MLFPFDTFVKYAPHHCLVCMCPPMSFCRVCTYPYTCICAHLCPFVVHVLTHILVYVPTFILLLCVCPSIYLCMFPRVSFCCVCVCPYTCVCAHVYPSVVYVSIHILLFCMFCLAWFPPLPRSPHTLPVLIAAFLSPNLVFTMVLILYVVCCLMFLHLS